MAVEGLKHETSAQTTLPSNQVIRRTPTEPHAKMTLLTGKGAAQIVINAKELFHVRHNPGFFLLKTY